MFLSWQDGTHGTCIFLMPEDLDLDVSFLLVNALFQVNLYFCIVLRMCVEFVKYNFKLSLN